jgi:hypothetical protein
MNKWWWFAPFDARWSKDEIDARGQLGGAAGVVFLCLAVPLNVFLPNQMHTAPVALGALIPAFAMSLLAARPVCNVFWPDVIRRGDVKAAERERTRS